MNGGRYWRLVQNRVRWWWRRHRPGRRRTTSAGSFVVRGANLPPAGSRRSPVLFRRMAAATNRYRWRLWLWRGLAVTAVTGVLGSIVVFLALMAWVANDLPNPNKMRTLTANGVTIVDRHGDPLYDIVQDERRSPVQLGEVPQYLRQATVAVEDKDFYKHGGFDPLTPLRMVYNVIVKHRIVGGSTLTQQLVKNALLSNERTIQRKVKEFILSLEIERQFSKDDILQMYFNETPYGGNAVGAGAAAQLFFGKDVSQLSLVESAILAGLPQRPGAYSPFLGGTTTDGEPLWQWRAKGVLRRMREDNYITSNLEEEALNQLTQIKFASKSVAIRAPHFVFYVQDQLEKLIGAERLAQGGIKVTTTLDLPFQQEAEQIVAEEIAKVEALHITNGAALTLDPNSGEILSMVGSKGYFAADIPGKFNVVTQGLRQPGSSIKPVTYLTALRQGKSPAFMLVDAETTFTPNDNPATKPYQPKNYDGKFRGPMSLRRALAESNNIVAVKLLSLVGVRNMLQTATDLGFTTLAPTDDNLKRFGLSVTLGGAEVPLIDTATAYSTFANGGRRVQPVAILEITDLKGNVLYKYRSVQGAQAILPEEAYLINSILSDDEARSGTFGRNSQLNIQNRPIAVKTGTTNDQRDNWTIGWSRSTLVGVWVGNNDNTAMKKVASGVTGASPIWRRKQLAAVASGRTTDPWEVPANVEQVKVDAVSGYPAHDDLSSREEWVVKGTLPSLPDPIHQKVRLCKGQNKLATNVDVQRSNYDEKVFTNLYESDPVSQDGKNRWQDGINAWIAQQSNAGDFQAPTSYCDSINEVYIQMDKPQDHQNLSETNVAVNVTVISEEKVDRVEIFVNGNLRETLRDKPYNTTLNLPSGRYTLMARGIRNDGKTGQTGDVHIGTGGTDWQEPTPTPAPTASASAQVSP